MKHLYLTILYQNLFLKPRFLYIKLLSLSFKIPFHLFYVSLFMWIIFLIIIGWICRKYKHFIMSWSFWGCQGLLEFVVLIRYVDFALGTSNISKLAIKLFILIRDFNDNISFVFISTFILMSFIFLFWLKRIQVKLFKLNKVNFRVWSFISIISKFRVTPIREFM